MSCVHCQGGRNSYCTDSCTDKPRRRRSESTPERLLLSLHCGHNFSERCSSSSGHQRRFTVADDQSWSPRPAPFCSCQTMACSKSLKHTAAREGALHKTVPLAVSGKLPEGEELCCSHCRRGQRIFHKQGDEGQCGTMPQPLLACGDNFAGSVANKAILFEGSSEENPDSRDKDKVEVMQAMPAEALPTQNKDAVTNTSSSKEDPSENNAKNAIFEDRVVKNGEECSHSRGEMSVGWRNRNENRRRKNCICESFDSLAARTEEPKSSTQRQCSYKTSAYVTRLNKEHDHFRKDGSIRSQTKGKSRMMNPAPPCVVQPGGGAGSQTSLENDDDEEDDEDDEEEEDSDADDGSADEMRVRSSQHRATLTANLYDLWRARRLCDVVLRAEDEEVLAHKLALAAFSSTFTHRYCEVKGSDGKLLHIDVPGTTAAGLKELLRFVYTGEISITLDNIGHILAAASCLDIDDVVTVCKQMLMQPSVDNVIYFHHLLEKYHLTDNLTYFYDFVCKHFPQVYRTRGWRSVTYGQVLDLLSDDNLNVDRELDVFYAALAWIDGDRSHRLSYAADLIGCVRFAYITPGEIAKHVETKQFLFQGDEGKELLLCIYRHHALQTCACKYGKHLKRLPRRKYRLVQDGSQLVSHVAKVAASSPETPTQRRHSHSLSLVPSRSDIILAAGGVNPFQPEMEVQARLVEQYNPRYNHWTTLTRLPDGRHHHGMAVLDGCIYVIGGSVLDELNPGHLCNPTGSCYRYQHASDQWSAIAPLHTARMYHATAVLADLIFAVAGQTHHSRRLSSVECYRPDVDEWEVGPELEEARIGVAVAAYMGLLFAAGGFLETDNEQLVRDTVEVYDHKTRRWTKRNPLPNPRCHAGLAVCAEKLYLIGGSTFPHDSPNVLSLASVMRYDEINDRWDKIQTLRMPRHDMGIAVLGTRIFVVGGVSSTDSQVLSDVECLDVEGSFWLDDVEALGNAALGLSCVTVPGDE